MPRYIDADKLKERINASCAFPNMGTDGIFLRLCTLDLIDTIPKADVVEVKHGEWMKEGCGLRVCSECNFEYDHAGMPNEGLEYCPNCGAKMDGGKNE